jgi:hypothetical protein
MPTFANRGRHVVSVTDPYGRILDFLDRIRYPVADPLHFFLVVPGIEPGPPDL